ncbi:Uu.00g015710.m01.CDS01 [Anthostomella pinea]|uniref:Uu.00g015710.m01.CDS01 n=1 Tax=Anthostomella pinea TaxID=933095 RepID=A0AAI8VYL5_9PEZI|nr:Uu.00g015710.m01.CDS01 [Anthostomella pinea]
MAQHGFSQFGGAQSHGGSVDPNDLAMSGTFGASYSNNFNGGGNNGGGNFFDDDELLDGLGSPTDPMSNQAGMHNQPRDFRGMNDLNMGYPQGMYTSHQSNPGLQMDQSHMNGYSNTPDGDPIQSPFIHNSFNQAQFRQMQHPQQFGNSLQSPVSYSGSPLAGSDLNNDGNDPNYLNAKSRAQLSQTMQRKASNTRSPLTPKTAAAMSTLTMNPRESPGYGTQPIRTPGGHQEKSPSGQWMHTPNSLSSFPGSGFSSPPIQHGMQNQQIADVLLKGGTSMPAKLNGPSTVSSQEMKRKRRRESHNLVERRRRDNINERIQDLSKLVPTHRLEDEKIRKLIQNGTPLSPSLTAITSPTQATSGLAGPGAKRATGAGNITTGLPLDDKDKGPNKGDILNGSVSWTRDLMWMLHLKLQQQEEMINIIADLGGNVPFELTDDEKRMQTELMEALSKNGPHTFAYTRFAGSGLRVPQHTDYKGDSLNGTESAMVSASPDDNDVLDLNGDMGDAGQFWNDPDDDGSGPASINFKEEDEYGMDLVHD